MTQTKAQHTSGPWKLGAAEYDSKGLRKVHTSQFHGIAQVLMRKATQAEDEANARLIAAAPELLAACEAALMHHGVEMGLDPSLVPPEACEQKHWCHQARAAIAKATH